MATQNRNRRIFRRETKKMVNTIFKLISFLSSFIGTIILIIGSYFLVSTLTFYSLIIGFIIVNTIILITRRNTFEVNKFLSFAKRKGFDRTQRNTMSKSLKNKFFSGHIARAFMITSTILIYDFLIGTKQLILITTTIFSVLVILSMMKLRRINLIKIMLSTILGSTAGLLSVVITNFIF